MSLILFYQSVQTEDRRPNLVSVVLSSQPDLVQACVEVGQGGVLLLAVQLQQLLTISDTAPLGSEPTRLLLEVKVHLSGLISL